jgi:hypothetical protein
MTLGMLIRLLIIVAWSGLFTYHVVSYAAPAWGLSERDVFASTLARNLGRQYIYAIEREQTRNQTTLGECSVSLVRTENGYERETMLRLDDIAQLAPGLSLMPQLAEATSRKLFVTLTESLTTQRNLSALRGNGSLLGLEATLNGNVTDKGLIGSYTINNGEAAAFTLAQITPDIAQGHDLAIMLPAGLKTGDQFTSRLLSPDLAQFRVNAKNAVFLVTENETITCASGPLLLLRVNVSVDNRLVSTLWCDQDGTVYRSRQTDGFAMNLRFIREVGGKILWPPQAATKP